MDFYVRDQRKKTARFKNIREYSVVLVFGELLIAHLADVIGSDLVLDRIMYRMVFAFPIFSRESAMARGAVTFASF